MKQIIRKAPILFLISFSLLGCTSNDERVLSDVQKHSGVKYLTSAKIVFSYTNITGFEDRSGPVYYVLDYTNSSKKEEFVNLYSLNKAKKNSGFEADVEAFIDKELISVYPSFDAQYKLDFDKPYASYSSDKLFLVYYEETSLVFFLYHLWIP